MSTLTTFAPLLLALGLFLALAAASLYGGADSSMGALTDSRGRKVRWLF